MGLPEMTLLMAGLAGMLVGLILGLLLSRWYERRGYLPRSAIAPIPAAAEDHRHNWYGQPYLHDPSLPAWVYACQEPGCTKVLRTNKPRSLLELVGKG